MNNENETTVETEQIPKDRNPFLALLLSFLASGLGHLYIGKIKSTITICSIYIAIALIFAFSKLATNFYCLVTLIFGLIIFQLIIHINVFYHARKTKNYTKQKYNKALVYIAYILLYGAFSNLLISETVLGIRTLKIPTTSGEPNFCVDDKIVVDVNAYENEKPKCGDIVVFELNDYSVIFTLVGLPGDNIEVTNEKLIINGDTCPLKFISKYEEVLNADTEIFDKYEETLPNGRKHLILKNVKMRERGNLILPPTKVPAGYYFMLGDNRDNALDCRYYGFISRDKIVGKVKFVLWNNYFNRINCKVE